MSQWRAKALELFPDLRLKIQDSETIGAFWIELSSLIHHFYRDSGERGLGNQPTLIRNICLYAVWCKNSESHNVREATLIEFYEQIPRLAARYRPPVYGKIIRDLVASIGRAEIEAAVKAASAYMKPAESDKFLAEVARAEHER